MCKLYRNTMWIKCAYLAPGTNIVNMVIFYWQRDEGVWDD